MKIKLEFSKLLATLVSLLYTYVVLFSSITFILDKGIPSELLSNIQVAFMVILSGYITKAGVENINKINK